MKKKYITIGIFILGLLIFLYPLFSEFIYTREFQKEIAAFDKNAHGLPTAEVKRRIELAKAYNRTLDPSKLQDPFTAEEKQGRAEYAKMLQLRSLIGYVEIPKIGIELPIRAGTSSEVLESGAGHLEGTSLPVGGKSTHTVITAHRGLPQAKLFRDLDMLKKGDIFYLYNLEEPLAYKVDKKEVVIPSDFGPILVTPGKDECTLLTCTPYMINSHRLLVHGHRVPYVPPSPTQLAYGFFTKYRVYILYLLPAVLLFIGIYLYGRRKDRKKKQAQANEVI